MFVEVYRCHVTESVTNDAKTFNIHSVIIHGYIAIAYVDVILNDFFKDHSKRQYNKFWNDIDDMVFASP